MPLAKGKPGDGRLARAIRERWEAFVAERAHRDIDRKIVFSERLLLELGEKGFATLLYLAEHGDRESARILVERLLGMPEQPYRVKVANLGREEAVAALKAELAELSLSPANIEGLIRRAEAKAVGEAAVKSGRGEGGGS